MSNPTHNSLDTPSGIDPEVLSRINALFQEPEMIIRRTLARRDGVRSPEAWWKTDAPQPADENESETTTNLEKTVVSSLAGDEDKAIENDVELNKDNFRLPQSESESDLDEDEPTEDDSLLPQEETPEPTTAAPSIPDVVIDPHALKIMARYIYPSEHHPGALPMPLNQPNPYQWPTLASLISALVNHLVGFFIDDTLAVIEYSNSEIKRKIDEAQVEAQVVKLTRIATSAPEKVVSVVALVHVGSNEQRRTVPIMAKPKRVRQLLKDYGVDGLVEDVYRPQIKDALKNLEQAM